LLMLILTADSSSRQLHDWMLPSPPPKMTTVGIAMKVRMMALCHRLYDPPDSGNTYIHTYIHHTYIHTYHEVHIVAR
jgi:hypothetical protein